ncbi:MAG: translation elongation factor Ts [Eubacteriales bacterium]|nr:translation elongation factor Ts [Eubacteriales bacterium]
MLMFTAQDVNKLRQATGVGMMDCKKALTETNGDFDKAVVYLREKGMAAAAKKADRIAAEGAVTSYIHMGGKIGVLVEVNCETDFVARSDNFQALCKDIAMQIAASNPKYIRREEVPAEVVASEREIALQQAINEGKKPEFADKIVNGRIEKFYKEVCLMEQEFVKDPSKDVTQVLNEAVLQIGEKITVRRFVRYEMGEGLEKRQDNLAEEVAKMMKA